MPVHIIRYNPHRYLVNGKVRTDSKTSREQRLLEVIADISDDQAEGLRIHYMFYDTVGERLKIQDDEGFTISDCCCPPIT